jgi:hypothetical protein
MDVVAVAFKVPAILETESALICSESIKVDVLSTVISCRALLLSPDKVRVAPSTT